MIRGRVEDYPRREERVFTGIPSIIRRPVRLIKTQTSLPEFKLPQICQRASLPVRKRHAESEAPEKSSIRGFAERI